METYMKKALTSIILTASVGLSGCKLSTQQPEGKTASIDQVAQAYKTADNEAMRTVDGVVYSFEEEKRARHVGLFISKSDLTEHYGFTTNEGPKGYNHEPRDNKSLGLKVGDPVRLYVNDENKVVRVEKRVVKE